MDGSDGDPDYRLFPEQFPDNYGTFHYDEKGLVSFIVGTTAQPGEGKYKNVEDKSLAFYDNIPGVMRIITGFDEVQNYVMQRCSKCRTMGLRDYFQHWKANNFTSAGGKLFLFNARRSSGQQEIFFDDNIHFDDCHIVNCVHLQDPGRRQWATGLMETHLVRVEPLESLFDRQYFIKHVERLEIGYERKLIARERLERLLLRVKTAQRFRMTLHHHEDHAVADLPTYDPWKKMRKCASTLPRTENEEYQLDDYDRL